MKPCIFIGSSTEGLDVAYSIQNNLETDAEVTVWTQNVFQPSQFSLESLIAYLKKADIGIFVFSTDDVLKIKGQEHSGVRDNVLFELGLWMGHLGRERSFIITPKESNLPLPSDLLGVYTLTYQANRIDGNYDAALAPPCNRIRRLLQVLINKSEIIPPELTLPLSERRDLLGSLQRELLREFEQKDTVSFAELREKYPSMSPGELSYRVDQLRLLMFIAPMKAQIDITDQTFQSTAGFRQFCLSRSSFVNNSKYCHIEPTDFKDRPESKV